MISQLKKVNMTKSSGLFFVVAAAALLVAVAAIVVCCNRSGRGDRARIEALERKLDWLTRNGAGGPMKQQQYQQLEKEKAADESEYDQVYQRHRLLQKNKRFATKKQLKSLRQSLLNEIDTVREQVNNIDDFVEKLVMNILNGEWFAKRVDSIVQPMYGKRLDAWDGRLACIHATSDSNDLWFTGCNVHVVNGPSPFEAGGTATANGLGNLIIGYNERETGQQRSGSHYLVLGEYNEYTSYGGIVGGTRNTVKVPYSAILSGTNNIAGSSEEHDDGEDRPGMFNAIIGGTRNVAYGRYSTIVGGEGNFVQGGTRGAVVVGGQGNEAGGLYSAVMGGYGNNATGYRSSVSGGSECVANNVGSSVLGGYRNQARGSYSTVLGSHDVVGPNTQYDISPIRRNNPDCLVWCPP